MGNMQNMVRLREAQRARTWLRQFDPPDRPVAAKLLDQLHLISATRFSARLQELLEAQLVPGEHVAAYAAREIGSEDQLFTDKRSRTKLPQVDVGSEGAIAYLLASLKRRSRGFLIEPSISSLKRYHVHTILVVDDGVFSGRRSRTFLQAFRRHPTISSWISRHYLRFKVVCFASTKDGIGDVQSALRFCHSKRKASIPIEVVAATSARSLATERSFRELCLKYGPRVGSSPLFLLGFGSLLTNVIFQHKCPNNAPSILWSHSPAWSPLFPGTSVPPDLVPAFLDQHFHSATEVGHRRLARLQEFLLFLSRGIRSLDALEQTERFDRTELLSLSARALETNLITEDWRLTMAGTRELRAAIAADRWVPPPKEDFFFPTALRRPGG